jgi:hypothetical protein
MILQSTHIIIGLKKTEIKGNLTALTFNAVVNVTVSGFVKQ